MSPKGLVVDTANFFADSISKTGSKSMVIKGYLHNSRREFHITILLFIIFNNKLQMKNI